MSPSSADLRPPCSQRLEPRPVEHDGVLPETLVILVEE